MTHDEITALGKLETLKLLELAALLHLLSTERFGPAGQGEPDTQFWERSEWTATLARIQGAINKMRGAVDYTAEDLAETLMYIEEDEAKRLHERVGVTNGNES